MNSFHAFFQQPGCWIVLLLLCVSLVGCGGGDNDSEERLAGPAASAALPIRVDATPTPTPAATATPNADATSTPPNETTPTDSPQDESAALTADATLLASETPTPIPLVSPTPNAAADEMKSDNDESETDSQDGEGGDPEHDASSPAAQPDEEKLPSKLPVTASNGMKLLQVKVCSKISNRNASNSGDEFSFKKTKKIYTWMKVSNAKTPVIAKHYYYLTGKLVDTVTLKLRYASMRSWSQKKLTAKEGVGQWKVVVTTENKDEVLAVREFTVTP